MSRYAGAKSTFDQKEATSISAGRNGLLSLFCVLSPLIGYPLSLSLADEVPGVVKSLRDTFNSDATLSMDARLTNLKAFQTMICEGRTDLCAAMQKDLHKSAFEGYVTELSVIESEIHLAIEHLAEWMTPKKTRLDIVKPSMPNANLNLSPVSPPSIVLLFCPSLNLLCCRSFAF
jgi:hypothetical protein